MRALLWPGVHEALFVPKAASSARVQSAVPLICSEEQSAPCNFKAAMKSPLQRQGDHIVLHTRSRYVQCMIADCPHPAAPQAP